MFKRLYSFIIILLFASVAFGATYYVDATGGNDGDTGLVGFPWQTIAKVNGESFSPNDSILFKRGEIWREQLTVPNSGSAGNPITFGAYGTGANPIIYRTNEVSNWYEVSHTPLFKNGGFEFYVTGDPNDSFQDWSVGASGGDTVKADTSVYHTANVSARLTVGGGGNPRMNHSFAASNNTTYYVSVWGRKSSATASCLRIRVKDEGNAKYLETDLSTWNASERWAITWDADPVDTWVQKTFSFTTAASGTTTIQLHYRNVVGGSSAWVDDEYINEDSIPSTKRVWGYVDFSLIKTSFGITDSGVRVPAHTSEINPVDMTDGYKSNSGTSYYVFYRNDAGDPGAMEVGIRSYAILIDDIDYIDVEDIDTFGPAGNLTGASDAGGLITISGTSDHINVSGGIHDCASSFGIWSENTTSNIIYDGLEVLGCKSTGIYNSSQTGSVINCIVHNNGNIITDSGDMGGIGSTFGGNLTISGNECYENGPAGGDADYEISVVGAVNPITITRNYVHDAYQGGIQVAEGGNNSIIAYNIIDTFGETTYAIGDESAGKFSGVRVGGGASGSAIVAVYNNVITGGAQAVDDAKRHAGISVLLAESTGLKIKNNIFYDNTCKSISVESTVVTTTHEYSNNDYYRSGAYTSSFYFKTGAQDSLAAWQAALVGNVVMADTDAIIADPLFVNATSGDFRLKVNSPCRDAGVDVGLTSDYTGRQVPLGNAPEIGAYELTTGQLIRNLLRAR